MIRRPCSKFLVPSKPSDSCFNGWPLGEMLLVISGEVIGGYVRYGYGNKHFSMIDDLN